MTSTVRIEKAEATHHTLSVQAQDKQPDGSWSDVGPAITITSPAEMISVHPHTTRRYVVSEAS